MKFRTLSILALAALAATACKKAEDGAETTTADTAVVPGTDTAQVNVAVPTTDTAITTTTTETDTIRGDAPDTIVADTTKR